MNQIDLNGRVAVVTGGARGIGLAVARRAAASGAALALWDLDAARLEQAAARPAGGHHHRHAGPRRPGGGPRRRRGGPRPRMAASTSW